MTQRVRERMLAGGLVVMLAAVALWSLDGMMQKRADARRAAADLAACKVLAGALSSAGHRSTAHPTESVGSQRLSKQIEAACQAAAISDKSTPGQPWLDGVFPQSAQRAADGVHLQVPTVLALRNVPLSQLAAFLYHLTSGSELGVRDLRLRAPRGEATEDAWDAEATVTYLMYTPAQD